MPGQFDLLFFSMIIYSTISTGPLTKVLILELHLKLNIEKMVLKSDIYLELLQYYLDTKPSL